MAHFIGYVQGSRGPASRLGGKASGINVEAAGWGTGAEVSIRHINGKDHVTVWRTSGSAGTGSRKVIAEWDDE